MLSVLLGIEIFVCVFLIVAPLVVVAVLYIQDYKQNKRDELKRRLSE